MGVDTGAEVTQKLTLEDYQLRALQSVIHLIDPQWAKCCNLGAMQNEINEAVERAKRIEEVARFTVCK